MTKRWKDIEGFENLYKISDSGEVLSFRLNIPKILKPALLNSGYLKLTLFKKDSYRHFTIHRLVALTFLNNPDNKRCVNHKDGNKLNNHCSNLEWVTHKENSRHGFDTGLIISSQKGRFGKYHGKSKQVIQMDKNGTIIKVWESITEIHNVLKVDISTISKVCKGKRKIAYGHMWRFVI